MAIGRRMKISETFIDITMTGILCGNHAGAAAQADEAVALADEKSALQRPSKPDAKSRCSTKFESADAQFCSSDSFAAACAIAHLC